MIAKKEWFDRRKYGGWGVSPNCWQGWVYFLLIILPFMVFQFLPFWSMELRMIVTVGWLAFLLADIIPVMINLNRDEREFKIEAIAERNAAWFMSLALVVGILYDIIISGLKGEPSVNLFFVIALLGGALVKTISNIILERRNI